MAGFENDVLLCTNVNFNPSLAKPHSGLITTDGQLIIGSTALNAGGTHLNIGTLTSTGATVTVTNGAGTINLEAGASVPTTFTANSGSAVPVANILNILGSSPVAGVIPIRTIGAANTITVQVQMTSAVAATDATRNGLAHFDSADFTVDANGFVTMSATGAVETITGDSGGALSPAANNLNILGRSGSKTSGAASTLTIKSPPFSQVGASATSALNSGEFVTAAVTRTLPVSAGLADGDLFIYVATTAGLLVIQSVGAQKIRIGSSISSAAGTASSTAAGDSVSLRFDATQGFFLAVSVVGNWILA